MHLLLISLATGKSNLNQYTVRSPGLIGKTSFTNFCIDLTVSNIERLCNGKYFKSVEGDRKYQSESQTQKVWGTKNTSPTMVIIDLLNKLIHMEQNIKGTYKAYYNGLDSRGGCVKC